MEGKPDWLPGFPVQIYCNRRQHVSARFWENGWLPSITSAAHLCGTGAKPVIDIMPVVDDVTLVDPLFPLFEEAGYECLGNSAFRAGGIFAREATSAPIRCTSLRKATNGTSNAIWRCGLLRTHPEEAAAYGALKTALAKRYPYDIEGYCDGKDAFCHSVGDQSSPVGADRQIAFFPENRAPDRRRCLRPEAFAIFLIAARIRRVSVCLGPFRLAGRPFRQDGRSYRPCRLHHWK